VELALKLVPESHYSEHQSRLSQRLARSLMTYVHFRASGAVYSRNLLGPRCDGGPCAVSPFRGACAVPHFAHSLPTPIKQATTRSVLLTVTHITIVRNSLPFSVSLTPNALCPRFFVVGRARKRRTHTTLNRQRKRTTLAALLTPS